MNGGADSRGYISQGRRTNTFRCWSTRVLCMTGCLSAVIVTTPRAPSAMKSFSSTRAVKLSVLGIVENVSGYVCPCCGRGRSAKCFSSGGGEEMGRREGVPLLGALPVDTEACLICWTVRRGRDLSFQKQGEPRGFGLAMRYQETPAVREAARYVARYAATSNIYKLEHGIMIYAPRI